MNQEIRLLLDQWTEAASFEFENGNPQYAQALEQCVIDLEKLTSPAGQEAPPLPIPLNTEQEKAAKQWAADDQLWTTQETVEFNLRTFARVILSSSPAGHPPAPQEAPMWSATTLDYDALDPGIRETVRLLNAAGFETSDSGDGVSKPADWYTSGEAIPFKHVVAATTVTTMIADAERMARLLGPAWNVEVEYQTLTKLAHLFAREIDEREGHPPVSLTVTRTPIDPELRDTIRQNIEAGREAAGHPPADPVRTFLEAKLAVYDGAIGAYLRQWLYDMTRPPAEEPAQEGQEEQKTFARTGKAEPPPTDPATAALD